MARGRGRGRGRGRVRSEKDLSADEGTSSSDDDAGDVLGAIDLVSSSLVFFKSALSNALSKEDFFSNEMPIDGEAVLALH